MSQDEPAARSKLGGFFLRHPIGAGLLSSAIFLMVFQPLLNIGLALIQSFVENASDHMVDRWYGQAVLGHEVLPSMYGLVIFFAFFIVTCIFVAQRAILIVIGKNDVRGRGRALENKFVAIASATYVLLSTIGITAYVAANIFVPTQANATFQRRLMALHGFATLAERDAFIAEWANVDSRADYERLMRSIEELAKRGTANFPLV